MQYILIVILVLTGGLAMGDAAEAASEKNKTAIFGGGCFWCMEPPFEQQEGVIEVVAGYSGGTTENPDYGQVSSGQTDHYEAIRVTYDSDKVSYLQLVDIFWRQINPTDGGGQFADRGSHYRTAIFYTGEDQRIVAEQSKKELGDSGIFSDPIVTSILPATKFYMAEEYHQDYYLKNVLHYSAYKKGSGRTDFIERVWKADDDSERQYSRPSDEKIQAVLNSIQFEVTQNDGTEPPFNNEFWDNKKSGLYVDVVSGEPLFSSVDKFDSGTGWPSFTKPVDADYVVEKSDRKLLMMRTEVRSRHGNSHLGHVFTDGPKPTGLRYCINSAALRFVPVEDLKREGYGNYLPLFNDKKE